MFKIVSVVDKNDTAIDRMAQGMAQYMGNIEYVVCDVHPKRPDATQIVKFEREAMSADVIDFQYFRTAEMLQAQYPWLKEKKRILTHHNPYSITEQNWNGYDCVVANNKTIYSALEKITDARLEYIPNTVDTDFWTFNPDWKPIGEKNSDKPSVIMVANRIENKKGILEVAIACGELGYKFILVGAISDANYSHSIKQTGNIEFHEQISDEQLRSLYYKSTIHVCNSKDNFESGTLPMIEAMLCGVPVLTRRIGHVPELYNGNNMVIHEGSNEDVIAIRDLLYEMVSDKKKLQDIREAGWKSAKIRSNRRRALTYQRLYRDVYFQGQTSVSVIMPVCEKPEITRETLNAIDNQTYQNIEIVIIDDGNSQKELVDDFKKYTSKLVRYIYANQEDYGLARARNLGVISATGEVLVFCDQRMVMEKDCIEQFLSRLNPKVWLYGNKGGKKDFIENLSCVYRQELIDFGMFNERINLYGGQSQELRVRFRRQGNQTEFVERAKATPRGKSSNKNRKREEIIKMKDSLWSMGLEE